LVVYNKNFIFVKQLKITYMKTLNQLKLNVPSIFATSASPKMSDKYVFVPTIDILENFEREGWEIASAKQTGLGLHGVHEIRLRNGELPKVGDTLVEAIIRNSHNGMTTLGVSAGLHRLVCSNGLTVPTALADSFNVRHQRFDLDDVKRLTESFAGKLPKIERSVNRMMRHEMTIDEKIDFVRKSAEIRFSKEKILNDLEIVGLLTPNRVEDEGDDMWKVFNVVQEKFVRGGMNYLSSKGQRTKLKGLQNIIAVNRVNTKLWELAESII
jgi:hypothetical protein